MAWITEGITNYIGGYVDSIVGGAMRAGGGFAGNAVGAVGDGINSFGGGIEKSIRRWGDGAKDYGNAIMDWTDADGPRQTTASNPLGLSNSITGGRRALGWSKSTTSTNSSPAYRAPSSVGTKAVVKPRSIGTSLPVSSKKSVHGTAQKVARTNVSITGTPMAKKTTGKAKISVGGSKKAPLTVTATAKKQVTMKKK